MKAVALAAVLAVFTLAGPAAAQYPQVYGTRGTHMAQWGYYSPYPGTLYSPFAAPPAVGYTPQYYYRGGTTYGNFGPVYVPPGPGAHTNSYGWYANPGFTNYGGRRW